MTVVPRETTTPAENSRLGSALTIVAGVMGVLVLVQAILAGRGLFIDNDYIDIHGMVANLVVLVALAEAVLAWFAMSRGLASRTLFGVCVALFILTVIQVGLGYGGRDNDTVASLHVPNGVLIFGLSVVAYVLAQTRRSAAP